MRKLRLSKYRLLVWPKVSQPSGRLTAGPLLSLALPGCWALSSYLLSRTRLTNLSTPKDPGGSSPWHLPVAQIQAPPLPSSPCHLAPSATPFLSPEPLQQGAKLVLAFARRLPYQSPWCLLCLLVLLIPPLISFNSSIHWAYSLSIYLIWLSSGLSTYQLYDLYKQLAS